MLTRYSATVTSVLFKGCTLLSEQNLENASHCLSYRPAVEGLCGTAAYCITDSGTFLWRRIPVSVSDRVATGAMLSTMLRAGGAPVVCGNGD